MVIDDATQAAIVNCLCEKLKACYIFPEIAEQISARLQQHLADGEYADITEGEFFAYALTFHLQEVNHDEHLWVRWHPEILPDDEGLLRNNPEWQAEQKLAAMLDNYGIYKVERLPGNVGFIDIRYFHRPEWGGDTINAAIDFLANTAAWIVDLRNCRGGYPGMIALFCSDLFGAQPIHLNSIYWRDEDILQEYWTQPAVAGRRLADLPVYLLISQATFSAGEEIAYTLKNLQRATLVGETTGGGAHPGASYRLHPHFEVFIPIGQVINPITGTNWAGSGVKPDISALPEQAFKIAYRLALESIIKSLGNSPFKPFKAFFEEAKTALQELKHEFKNH